MNATASWPALGTTVVLVVSDERRLARARDVVQRELEAIDAACSRFRPDAELVALNHARGVPVRVSALLREAIGAALWAAWVTDGAVDPTIGRGLRAAGYDRDFAQLPADGPAAGVGGVPIPAGGYECVEVSGDGTVRMPSGVELDLGATAKAWAADRAAEHAARRSACGVLLSLGGDVAIAGEPPYDDGWPVGIADDHSETGETPVIALRAGGLATSSTTVRAWRRDGRPAHHILDPWSGRPARVVWRTVSVAAPTCVEANAASTAAIVLGERAPDWLAERRLDARLVARDGEVSTAGRWPVAALTR
jgi:thiamine biosynthesis lipoprotein